MYAFEDTCDVSAIISVSSENTAMVSATYVLEDHEISATLPVCFGRHM